MRKSPSVSQLLRIAKKKYPKLRLGLVHSSGIVRAWKEADLLILGDGPVIASYPEFWAKNRQVRLWTLSEAHRQILVTILGFPKRNVGVLRLRKQLNSEPRPLGEITDLLIAGRFVRSKNIGGSLDLACRLRGRHREIRRIHASSPSSFSELGPFEKAMVRKYRKRGVRFHFSQGPGFWKRFPKTTAVIHLSKDYTEDFGVSCWQAAQAGFTLIVSEWGAHLDPDFPDCLRVSRSGSKMSRHFSRVTSTSAPATIASAKLAARVAQVTEKERELLKCVFMNHLPPQVARSRIKRKIDSIMTKAAN